jgi:hypothetical protein
MSFILIFNTNNIIVILRTMKRLTPKDVAAGKGLRCLSPKTKVFTANYSRKYCFPHIARFGIKFNKPQDEEISRTDSCGFGIMTWLSSGHI